VALFAGAVMILLQWPTIVSITRNRMVENLSAFPHHDLTIQACQIILLQLIREVAMASAPTILVLLLVGLVASVAQVGLMFNPSALELNLGRLNPLPGLQRLFSMNGWVNLIKGILKIAIVGYFAYQVIHDRYVTLVTALRLDRQHLGALLADTAWNIAWRSAIMLFLLGLADYAYNRWDWFKNLKMTKQEVKDEAKAQEGNPEAKAEQKKRMRQAARRRMMKAVPQATVVITNPTHYAIAIQYERATMEVPVVVAKGTDLVAKRIRDIAREAGVPLIENKPVAQALYRVVDIGEEIPPDFYAVVAEILVAVTRADRRALRA